MHGRDDRENKGGAQKAVCEDPDQSPGSDLEEQNKKDGADLRTGIGFAKNAGTKIAQAGNHEEYAAEEQDRDVAAKDYDRVLPWDLALDGEHHEHRAHEELVGDRVKILTEHGLLMQRAGEQPVEAVAQAGKNEERQRPFEIVFDYVDDNEGQEDHPQQRELIRRGQDLTKIHRVTLNAWYLRRGVSASGNLWRFLFARRPLPRCVSHLRSEAGETR